MKGGGETGEDGITRYKVKGSIWQDNNKDGQRQDDEETIRGITVHLINVVEGKKQEF